MQLRATEARTRDARIEYGRMLSAHAKGVSSPANQVRKVTIVGRNDVAGPEVNPS